MTSARAVDGEFVNRASKSCSRALPYLPKAPPDSVRSPPEPSRALLPLGPKVVSEIHVSAGRVTNKYFNTLYRRTTLQTISKSHRVPLPNKHFEILSGTTLSLGSWPGAAAQTLFHTRGGPG